MNNKSYIRMLERREEEIEECRTQQLEAEVTAKKRADPIVNLIEKYHSAIYELVDQESIDVYPAQLRTVIYKCLLVFSDSGESS